MNLDSSFSVPALHLLNAQRMDLIVKYMLFHSIASGIQSNDAEKLYKKHIMARTGGIEPPNYDGTPHVKNNVEDYLSAAKELWENMAEKGYDPAWPVPLGRDGLLLNAAHRIACAAQLGLTIPVVNQDRNGNAWDFDWFRTHGFTPNELALLLENYTRLTSQRTILFVLWGPVLASWEELTQTIGAIGAVLCQNINVVDTQRKVNDSGVVGQCERLPLPFGTCFIPRRNR